MSGRRQLLVWCAARTGPEPRQGPNRKALVIDSDRHHSLVGARHGSISRVLATAAQFPHCSRGRHPIRTLAPRFDVTDKPRQVANQADCAQSAVAAQGSLGGALGSRSAGIPLGATNAAFVACLFGLAGICCKEQGATGCDNAMGEEDTSIRCLSIGATGRSTTKTENVAWHCSKTPHWSAHVGWGMLHSIARGTDAQVLYGARSEHATADQDAEIGHTAHQEGD